MNLVKGSLQDELDHFFTVVNDEDCDFRHVTKSAFCQARQKLSHTAFVELNHHLIAQFHSFAEVETWYGKRLIAVDGSTFRLPNKKPIIEHFGQQDKGPPLARVSFCTEVSSGITLDTIVSPYHVGEREMAVSHVEKTTKNDLSIYDRGYHGFFMFAQHRHHERDFCMRMPLDQYTAVTDFLRSEKTDAIITLDPTPEAKKQCDEHNISSAPLSLRAVRIVLSNGEIEVLVTSLDDQDRYPEGAFQALYHQRWSIEESIKKKKLPLEIENFTGLSVSAVLQDIFAKVFMHNIVAIARTIAQKTVDHESKNKKYRYQINATQALSKAKDVLFKMILLSAHKAKILAHKFLKILTQCIEPVRDGRSYPRNHKTHKRVYHPNIKRTR